MIHDYNARTDIGMRIRLLRERKGWTVEELAEAIDVEPRNIVRIEEGKYNVSVDILSPIAKALGCRLTII